jgi:acylphosphatase
MKARHLLIAGRVQGVGFREWLVETARAHHLAGWVRNRADGRVEAVLAGEEPAIAAVLLLARRGPPLAEVSDIEENFCEPPEEPGFIRRPSI